MKNVERRLKILPGDTSFWQSLEGLSDGGSSGRRPFLVNASKTLISHIKWRDGKILKFIYPNAKTMKKKKTSRRYCSTFAVYFLLDISSERGSMVTHARLIVKGDLLCLIASPVPSQI